MCEGSNLSLYVGATNGSSYAWTGPNGFSSNMQNPVITNASIINSGNYVVTVSLNSCSTTANTDASVVASPNANISGDLDICVGENTTLTASGGTNYLWSTGATTPSINVTPYTTTTYSVVVTASGGCSETVFATVIVNSYAVITIAASNNNICDGESVILTASGATTYLWSTGATTPSISVSPSSTTNYSVTGTNTSGCTASANITITVNPNVIVSLNLPQEQICLDANPLTLTGGNPVGGTYYGEGIHNGLFYPSTVGVGTYNIYYEYENIYGCKATASKLLAVNPLPTVLFNSIFPNPVDLNAAAFQLNTGIPLGGGYSGPGVVNGWFYPSMAGVGIHTITYTYIDFMGCTNSAMVTITVVNGLGVEEQNSSKIRIYPNPAIDYLNIEMEEKADYVQIFNLTGSMLSTIKVNSEKFRVDVSYLSKGIYFMKFIFENGNVGVVKFVK
ncbi:MAG: T9SS type A sorting domain-containing protein [Candidatus Absconditicoccaceae bacterium]